MIWVENMFDNSLDVAVTKALSIYFSVDDIFDLANTPVKSYLSCSYLTGVAATQLQELCQIWTWYLIGTYFLDSTDTQYSEKGEK